ncbi:MAG: hypothetical protein V5A66_03615 [Candidatus Thermoplasmatota archaeon]
MLEGLLGKKLDGLKNEDILVVMDDGLGFLGELKEFDKKTLVLKKVLQSNFEEIDWKQISVDSKKFREKRQNDKKVGFANWSHVNLEEVYIRTDHISRIWPWIKKEKIPEGLEGETEEEKRPIYFEEDYL